MSHPNDSQEAWAIWTPWAGLTWVETSPTRNGAIREFVINLDSEALGEYKESGRLAISHSSEALTPTQRRAWGRWKAKGAMAVRVTISVADNHVREAHAAYEASKKAGDA